MRRNANFRFGHGKNVMLTLLKKGADGNVNHRFSWFPMQKVHCVEIALPLN